MTASCRNHTWEIKFQTKQELADIQPNEAELQAEVKDELENFFPFYNIEIATIETISSSKGTEQ